MADTPIVELEYLAGLTVIDIGDLRIARGMSRRPVTACNHIRLVYDRQERRVWCKDCETNVEAFDAFEMVANRAHAHVKSLKEWEARLSEIDVFKARLLATKQIERAWASPRTAIVCPCCKNGLLPEDFKHGAATMDRAFAKQRRGIRTP